jgi:hypothetical protein
LAVARFAPAQASYPRESRRLRLTFHAVTSPRRTAGIPIRQALHHGYRVSAPAGRFLRRQWPAVVCLLLAASFAIGTLAVRFYDGRPATVEEWQIREQRIGVYADSKTVAALTPNPEPAFVRAGLKAPETRWSVEVEPGPVAHGKIELVLLNGPGVWHLDVTDPVQVTLALPNGAQLDDRNRTIRADSEGTCASWYDGKTVHYARPHVSRSTLGDVAVTCIVPAIGRVPNLMFEVPFHWPDHTRTAVGFGRHTSWAHAETIETYPSDIDLPGVDRRENQILMPLQLQLDLAQGDRLIDAFPGPSGGGLDQREWLVERLGGDIQYTIERARDRAWVQPMTELSLMLAGVAFGLLPSLWRRKH